MNEEKLVVFQFDYLRMIYYTINKIKAGIMLPKACCYI